METVVLDTNVLLSNSLRGLFLWMQWRKVCEIIWSKEIWDEAFRNHSKDDAVAKMFREDTEKIIFAKFPDSMRLLNSGFQSVGLPDKNDEHVVALARQEGVSTIVTFNLKDFPSQILKTIGLQAIHPDLFLVGLFANSTDELKGVVKEHITFLRNTKPKKASYIESLKKANVTSFAIQLETEDSAGNLFPEVWD